MNDYYILSSNRGWGSIPTVPEKYPKMSKFYRDLLEEETNYKKIKEFTPDWNWYSKFAKPEDISMTGLVPLSTISFYQK